MDLEALLKDLPLSKHPDLLVGMEHGADAGVYRLSPEIAIVQSADFFPPLISDARAFGRVAAANALSDIYAMGARPVTALNLLATPLNESTEGLSAMLGGALEVIQEAGAVLCGGHTILAKTIMYGLSVTGVVHPDKLVRNVTLQPGDLLVLTKPLGSGITVHAFNAGATGSNALDHCVMVMGTLNRLPGELLQEVGAHAATDITGFGLLGHALDMLALGGSGINLRFVRVPLLPQVGELAVAGNYPAGSQRNAEYTDCKVVYHNSPPEARLVLNDAQTSGGLLIAVPPVGAKRLLDRLNYLGYPLAVGIIGEVVVDHPGQIHVYHDQPLYSGDSPKWLGC